jgi:hypothetical protein
VESVPEVVTVAAVVSCVPFTISVAVIVFADRDTPSSLIESCVCAEALASGTIIGLASRSTAIRAIGIIGFNIRGREWCLYRV